MKRFIPLILSLLISLGIWWYLNSFEEFQINRIEPEPQSSGLCSQYVFDAAGNRYDYFYGSLENPPAGVQLFLIPQEKLFEAGYIESVDPSNCVKYPDQVSPDETRKFGIPLVPIRFNAGFPSNKIRKGSSVILTASIEVVDEQDAEQWIALGEDGTALLTFQIEQTNFIFSPSQEDPVESTLSQLQPAESQWVVAPKEDAKGEQVILILVLGDQFGTRYQLDVQIQSSFGEMPVFLGVVITLVGFVASSLDIVEKLQKLFIKRSAQADQEKASSESPSSPDG